MIRRAGHEVRLLSNLIKRQIDTEVSMLGNPDVTGVQGRIIGYLYDHRDEEIFQRDVEAEFGIRRSTVTGILQLMEKNGLIERYGVARDARLKRLVLTQKAIAAHRQIEERIDRVEARLLQGISEEEIAQFYSVVDRMKENLQS